MNISKLLLQPIITEASTLNTEKHNQYTFKVNPRSSKDGIAKAIKEMYKVEVLKVTTLSVKARSRRFGKKVGSLSSWKKAFVTLKAGQKIDFEKGTK
ncbi:MAG: 50S ribosomal protein L23 [bacterium]